MPLMIDSDRVPKHWEEKQRIRGAARAGRAIAHARAIRIAFINNMPDPALQETEMQFFELLSAAAAEATISLKLFSLPGVPRAGQALEHVSECYSPIDDLWHAAFDAAIITGTEPRQSNLRHEPYWEVLTAVLDWASKNTHSTILSCLAAHASVLHNDGIERRRLTSKRAGVFEVRPVSNHPLTKRVPRLYGIPHSRWNDLREDDLISRGYTVLTRSSEAGADSFLKRIRNSLFLHFQGHPEYEAHTLLKEYRRDVKRFLRAERDDYPTMPHGYFDAKARDLLENFHDRALRERREDLIEVFPQAAVTQTLQRTWNLASRCIYRNWLKYVSTQRAGRQEFTPATGVIPAAVGPGQSKHSAVS
jgi:homoserine O-succinyltransferase/O-acetyltransferase